MADPDQSGDERSAASGSLRGWHFILIVVIAVAAVVLLYLYISRKDLERPAMPPVTGVTEVPEGSRVVALFFADEEGEGLIQETREVAIGAELSQQVDQIVRALLEGPRRDGVSTIPAGTRLLNAFFNAETATVYLDFSSELIAGHPGGSSAEYYTIAAIVRTVSENSPEVQAIQILVEGLQVGTIGGHINAHRPFLVRDWR
jgi:hypothetical protein